MRNNIRDLIDVAKAADELSRDEEFPDKSLSELWNNLANALAKLRGEG